MVSPMIVSIWVFFLLGDPLSSDHGTPYVQFEASQSWHDDANRRELIEHRCHEIYDATYPGHPVCDSGWCRQEVKVMGG
jgi:hypothetical protein